MDLDPMHTRMRTVILIKLRARGAKLEEDYVALELTITIEGRQGVEYRHNMGTHPGTFLDYLLYCSAKFLDRILKYRTLLPDFARVAARASAPVTPQHTVPSPLGSAGPLVCVDAKDSSHVCTQLRFITLAPLVCAVAPCFVIVPRLP